MFVRLLTMNHKHVPQAVAETELMRGAPVDGGAFIASVPKNYDGINAMIDPKMIASDKIAVGVDLKDGYVAIKGWTETSELTAEDFFSQMEQLGVKTVICTDISRDGAMKGTNRALYKQLSGQFSIDLIASGGVSTMEDILALKEMGLHGAIIGKAYYTGAIDLKEALEAAR